MTLGRAAVGDGGAGAGGPAEPSRDGCWGVEAPLGPHSTVVPVCLSSSELLRRRNIIFSSSPSFQIRKAKPLSSRAVSKGGV